MKKLGFILLAALGAAVLLPSCNDSDGDYPSYYAFSTVKPLENNNYFFELDNNKTIYPGDKTLVGAYSFEEGQRAIIYFNYLDMKTDGYDKTAKLYSIREILSGQTGIAATEEELKAFGEDKTSYYHEMGVPELNKNYLNIEIGFFAGDLSKHKFTLVRNDATDPAESVEGYLNLELRHDAGGDNSGYDLMEFISFDMEQFKADMEGKKGIIVRFSTRINGVKYIQIDQQKEN